MKKIIQLNDIESFQADDDTKIMCYNIIKRKLKKDFRNIQKNTIFDNYIKILSTHELRYQAIKDVVNQLKKIVFFDQYNEESDLNDKYGELIYDKKRVILNLVGRNLLISHNELEDISSAEGVSYLQGFDVSLDSLLYGIVECVISFSKNLDYELLQDNIFFINSKIQEILWGPDELFDESLHKYYNEAITILDTIASRYIKNEDDPLYMYALSYKNIQGEIDEQ